MRGWTSPTRLCALLVAIALSTACAGRDVRGPFRTQFVDAETGKPIEGVVFLVVWHSLVPNLVVSPNERFYEAQEAVSGPDGRVEISGLQGSVWKVAIGVRFHDLAPGGYVTQRMEVTPSDGLPYIDPTVTFIRRIANADERCRGVALASALLSFQARNASPLYIDAIARERAELRCG